MKAAKITAILLIFTVIVGFSTNYWLDAQHEANLEETAEAAELTEDHKPVKKEEPLVIEDIVKVPTVDELRERYPFSMEEERMQEVIHHMSHQKVHSSPKWGHILITGETVNHLLKVVERNSYTHEAIYHGILSRWSEEDFSKAVEDHNSIWRLQGGTVGRATRLMTKEEERVYVERHFGE
ncbi:DUF6241 domain-containing protein [Alteribacter aurantiacus]|uniref:DUF6241 domain-containing protein n=1 Tax=Alteribacter aurantiacus TaxID=254410 RepID=UPI000406A5A0|nr:DUF6241 domain-containing protein [Alteribacter aurantiacus]